MSAHSFETLRPHVGHKLECVTYGDNENVVIECTDCNEILLSFNKDEEEE